MSQFVETIKLYNGVFYRLKFHQMRVNKAFDQFFPTEEPVNVVEHIYQTIFPQDGMYKCRMVYNADVVAMEYLPYERRNIKSLKVIDTQIESSVCKFDDRTDYNAAFMLRGVCDDVLLVKNGLLTDTSYCNIALFDGNEWFTPRIPLLYGVNRADLLVQNKLIERDIDVSQLKQYQKITLFNAMIEFGEIVLDINQIVIS